MRTLAMSVVVAFFVVVTSVIGQAATGATEDQPTPFVPTIPAGMSRMSDITSDPDTPQPPKGLTAVGGKLLSLAADGLTYRLWRSDGTEEGTVPVGDGPTFDCSEDWSWCEYGFELVESDSLAYLAPNSGRGLWRSDGTDDGTIRLADVHAGYLHDIDGALYFVGDGNRGPELWRSDGSVDGTGQVRDIAPGRSGSICPMTGGDSCLDEVYTMGQLDGRVLFGANEGTRDRAGGDDLWVSDRYRRGTRRLTRMPARARGDGSAYPAWYQSAGDRLYVAMDDRDHGYELWVTDGTRRGTRLVRDIRMGREDGIRPGDRPLGIIGDAVIFAATNGTHGHELWRSDGTAEGTELVAEINVDGPTHPWPAELAVVADTLFLIADDGLHGPELWKYETEVPAGA